MQVQSHIQGEFWMYAGPVCETNANRTRSELDGVFRRPAAPNRSGMRLCESITL
jgi:hypothetical protein